MLDRRIKSLILIALWVALIEDTLLFLMAWFRPQLWFQLFHQTIPVPLEIALLRRAAGQWLAFAIAQAVTIFFWKKYPLWLVITAGVRFSDLFTDISYVISVPSLTSLGWMCLLPPPVLNTIVIVLVLWGYRQIEGTGRAPA
jgi:hypothetical protein